jgi:steroid delta-isomerase-like uncharacterized protein
MATAEQISTDELTAFVASYLDAWNSFDASRMAPLVTDDIVWRDPALAQPARSIEEIQAFMRASWQGFPDLRFSNSEPRHLSVDGDTVAWGWQMTGTMRGPLDPPGFAPTNRSMTVEGVDTWQMRDGRIARYRAYYDMNDVARQLGIVPETGSRAERGVVAMQRLQARFMRR